MPSRPMAFIRRATVQRAIIRGKPIRTTVSDKAAPCPLDHVNRQFHASAPNMLWVSDFTSAKRSVYRMLTYWCLYRCDG